MISNSGGLGDELASAHPPIILNMGITSAVASVGNKALEAFIGSRWYSASGNVVNIALKVLAV